MKKTMKIMAMVLFVLGMTALTSCTKSKESLIIGKWKLESISATYQGQSFEMSVADFASMFGGEGEVEEMYLEFKDDGYVYSEGESIAYSINGDKLTITGGGETIEMDITELTSSAMTLETEEEGVQMALHFKKV